MADRLNKDIDGMPRVTERGFKRPTKKILARYALHNMVEYFEAGNGDGLVTWVETETSWDGYAMVLKDLSPAGLALKLFHVNRTEGSLISQHSMEVSLDDDLDKKSVEAQVDVVKEGFDRSSLEHVIAMIQKASRTGEESNRQYVDPFVKNVIVEEYLETLAQLFPRKVIEKNVEVASPFVDPEIIDALRQLSRQERTRETGNSVFLQKMFEPGEKGDRYAMHAMFDDSGEPASVHFLQQKGGVWLGEFFDYGDTDIYFVHPDYDWDEEYLLRTIQRGIELSEEAFEVFRQDSFVNESGDFSIFDDDSTY